MTRIGDSEEEERQVRADATEHEQCEGRERKVGDGVGAALDAVVHAIEDLQTAKKELEKLDG